MSLGGLKSLPADVRVWESGLIQCSHKTSSDGKQTSPSSRGKPVFKDSLLRSTDAAARPDK